MSNNPNYNSLDDTTTHEPTDTDNILSKKKKKSSKKLQEEGESHEYDELLSSTYQSSDVVSFPRVVNPLTQNPLISSSKRRVYPPELLNKKPEVTPTSENSTEKASKKKKKSPKHHEPEDSHDPFHYPLTNLHSAGEDSGDDKDEVEEILSYGPYHKHKSASLNEFHPYCVGLYIAIFIFAVALCYGILALTQTFACLGPPYLYVTHKGSKNIMKFSRDGCLIHEKVLWGVSNEESDLRGMAYGKYNQKEVLYVADANTAMSGVIMFGECFDSTSLRPFVSRVVTAMTNPGALHTYGVAVDRNGDIYASFQKSDAVLRFTSQTFQPIPNRADLTPIFYFSGNDHDGLGKKEKKKEDSPSKSPTTAVDNNDNNTSTNGTTTEKTKKNKEKKSKDKHKDDDNNSTASALIPVRRLTNEPQHYHHRHLRTIEQPNFNELQNISAYFAQQKYGNIEPSDYFNGTFVQFGFPYFKHDSTERGIRAIVWVKNYTELWIANQDLNAVVIVDREGTFLTSIWIKNPIGMYHSQDHPNLIFISSKQKKLGGVFAFDVESRMQVRSYQSIGMNHPTGMVSYHDILFVGDQTRNAVITFNITTSRVIKLIIPSTKLHGEIEHIILSHC